MSEGNTPNPGEFLVELEEKEAFLSLHSCFTLNSDIILKNEIDPATISARISFFADNKVYLETAHADKLATFSGQTSIKFFIGTEVYFIKTTLEVIDGQVCFDQNSKIIQFRRRKEPRYNIPEKWTQSAAIWSIELKIKNVAKVTDISSGGCRFEVPNLKLDIKKGDQIRIQFQIFKRADIVCDAIVRFVMRKPSGTAVLGLEFTQLQKSHKSRINSIVDDLVNHYILKNLL